MRMTAAHPIAPPADFGGRCLIGRCSFDASVVDLTTTSLGLRKEGSYLYGTWRDEDGNVLWRARLTPKETK